MLFQSQDQEALWQQILDIVNKTNMIDYTMDIRMRLNMGDKVPDELAQRKQKVLATLIELQEEVAPVTKATELLKDTDCVKDSKTFVAALTRGDYGVCHSMILHL